MDGKQVCDRVTLQLAGPACTARAAVQAHELRNLTVIPCLHATQGRPSHHMEQQHTWAASRVCSAGLLSRPCTQLCSVSMLWQRGELCGTGCHCVLPVHICQYTSTRRHPLRNIHHAWLAKPPCSGGARLGAASTSFCAPLTQRRALHLRPAPYAGCQARHCHQWACNGRAARARTG